MTESDQVATANVHSTHKNDSNVPLIQVEQVQKSFGAGQGAVTALADVSLQIESGEFVAIMGASGSGKSTLLNLIGGLTTPDAGRVIVERQDLAKLNDRRLTRFRRDRIGFVFQAFNLIPTLSATDNIQLPVLAGGSPGRLSAEEALERVGLAARKEHHPDELSGGEQQRVAIARALISDPPILLADEPTGNLDSQSSAQIGDLLKTLQTDLHRTIIVVTHEPAVALWADRVVVLKDGRKLTEFETSSFENTLALAAHYHEVLERDVPSESDAKPVDGRHA